MKQNYTDKLYIRTMLNKKYVYLMTDNGFCFLSRYYDNTFLPDDRFMDYVSDMLELNIYNYNDYLSKHSAEHCLSDLEFIVRFFQDVRIRDLYDGLDV